MGNQIRFSAGKSSPAARYILNAGRTRSINDIVASADMKASLSDSVLINRAFERLNSILSKEFPYQLDTGEWQIILSAFNGDSNLSVDSIGYIPSGCFEDLGVEANELDENIDDDDLKSLHKSLSMIRDLTYVECVCIAEVIERFWCKHNKIKNRSIESVISDLTGMHPRLCVGVDSEEEFYSRFNAIPQKRSLPHMTNYEIRLSEELVAEVLVDKSDAKNIKFKAKVFDQSLRARQFDAISVIEKYI